MKKVGINFIDIIDIRSIRILFRFHPHEPMAPSRVCFWPAATSRATASREGAVAEVTVRSTPTLAPLSSVTLSAPPHSRRHRPRPPITRLRAARVAREVG
jgi:hypothetical protein